MAAARSRPCWNAPPPARADGWCGRCLVMAFPTCPGQAPAAIIATETARAAMPGRLVPRRQDRPARRAEGQLFRCAIAASVSEGNPGSRERRPLASGTARPSARGRLHATITVRGEDGHGRLVERRGRAVPSVVVSVQHAWAAVTPTPTATTAAGTRDGGSVQHRQRSASHSFGAPGISAMKARSSRS